MHLRFYPQNSSNTIHPTNMVCFRYIIVNALHKRDDDDDDDTWVVQI
jgi:hypothetical protein